MKLYVGNLPYSIRSDEELGQLFADYELESAQLILDRESGRPKGFGFVIFKSKEDALDVVKKFNGADVGGRAIIVNEARPLEKRAPTRGDRPSYGGGNRHGGGGGGGRSFGGGHGGRQRSSY